ncbi:hypothetical protein KIN20_032312 [Parelaphostrongylus tenuis]|uniref:Uncharacterized protein n=1 Tax=Parelaphostrongylus tenuis TaxID=148309 RepID=A0AAD5WHZ4_PARTN|nr:hypothetical protein KIN20_032312 [Parelaphostrongylus tenuis]
MPARSRKAPLSQQLVHRCSPNRSNVAEEYLPDWSVREEVERSAETPEDDKKWDEVENLVHLYNHGVQFYSLENLPDEVSWYKEAFHNYNACRSSTASSQERKNTDSSSTAPSSSQMENGKESSSNSDSVLK